MSDPITPQLQEKVLNQLREMSATRNFAKTPEEIEKVLMEKSRGNKKAYLEYFSQVMNWVPTAAASTSGGSHLVPAVSNPDHMVNTGQTNTGHLIPGPRPGLVLQSNPVSQPGQIVHVLPTSTTVNTGPQPATLGVSRPPRLLTIAPQTNSPLHMQQAVFQTQPVQQRTDSQPSMQPMQPAQPGAIVSTPNRIVLIQSGGPSGTLRRLVTLPVSLSTPRPTIPNAVVSHQQHQQQPQQAGGQCQPPPPPLVLYPQPVNQQTQNVMSADQSQQQQTVGRPIQIHAQNPGQQVTYQGESYSGQPGSTPVLIRSGPISTTASSETSTTLPAIIVPTSSPTVASTRPVITVVPGNPVTAASQGPAKVIRANLAPGSKTPAQGIKLSTVLSSGVSSQPSTTMAPSKANAGPTAGRLGPQPAPDASRSGNPAPSSGTSSTKQPPQPHPAEIQAEIVNGLNKLAARFLPAVRHALQVVSELPDSAASVRKYIKLRDILEHPESNLNVIHLRQLPLIEQLLNEISRNPMQIFQQNQQQKLQQGKSSSSTHPSQQRSNQARATAAAAAVAAAAAKTMISGACSEVARNAGEVTGTLATSDQAELHRLTSGTQLKTVQQQPQSGIPHPQQAARVRVSPAVSTATAAPGVATDAHGAVASGQAPSSVRGSGPMRIAVYGTGADNSTANALNQPLGVSTMEPGGSSAANMSVSLPGLWRHPAPENRVAPQTSTGFPLGFSGGSGAIRASIVSSFPNYIQPLISELKKMSDCALKDPSYARRVCRAINVISQETKPFRESMGLLLPEDLHLCMSTMGGKINESDSIKTSSGKEQLAIEHVDDDGTERVSVGKRLRPTANTDQDDSDGCLTSLGGHMTRNTDAKVERSEIAPTAIECADSVESEPCGKKRRVDRKLDPTNHEDTPFITGHSTDMFDGKSKVSNKETPVTANYLFTKNTIPYDPEADPLTSFGYDQIERLNPRIQREIQQLYAINLYVQANPHPPPIDEMENYVTCLDAGEWNTSCHLKVIPKAELIAQLPCAPPILLVRLAPDYLEAGQMNWYYEPRSKCSQPDSTVMHNSMPYSPGERAHFLDLCYAELDRKLQQHLRRASHYRLTLFLLGKHWLNSVCSAMARFVKIDQSIPLLAK